MSYPISLFFDISQTYFFYTNEVEVHDISGKKEKYRLILPDCFDFPLVDQLFRKKVVRGFLKQGFTPALTEKGVVLKPPNKQAKLLDLCSKIEGLDDENKMLLHGFSAMLKKGQYGLAGDCIKTLYEIAPQTALLELYAEYLLFIQGPVKTRSCKAPSGSNPPAKLQRKRQISQESLMCMQLYQRDNKRTDLLLDALLADPHNEEASEALDAFGRSPSAGMNLYLYIYVRTGSELFLKKASRIDTKSPLPFLAQVACARNQAEKRESYAKLADLYTELGELDQARYYRSKNPSAFFNYVTTTTRERILPKEDAGDQGRRGEVNHLVTYKSKEIRRGLLEYIDSALKQKEWDHPDQVIHGLIMSVVFQLKISEGSFYKRCVLVCQDQGRREFYLKRLWEHYTSRNKIDKAAVVYKLTSLNLVEFDRHLQMIIFLSEKGQLISEMARNLFLLARHAIELNQLEKALPCLSLLEKHDQALFSHHEKIVIFLMRKIVDLNLNERALQEVQPPSLKLWHPVQAVPQKVRKRGVVMHLGHPVFFSCYADSYYRYFFSEKKVEVVSYKKGSAMSYPLRLVRPSDMPIESKLSTKDAIQWLLDKGYSPVVTENDITFTQLTDRDLFRPVKEQCAAICRDRHQRDTLQAQLLTVQACLDEELYSVAISYLQKAYQTSQSMRSEEARVKKLYDYANELKLQTFVCLEGAEGISDPRIEWMSRCSSLCAELEGIHDELALSLQASKLYVELGSYTLAKPFLEAAVKTCPSGSFEGRVRELHDSCAQIMRDAGSTPLASALEDKPTLSEETFNTLACLSQLPASNKKTREKLYRKLVKCDSQNREHYERQMQQVPQLQTQKLLGLEEAKELLQHYQTSGKLEEARIVAQYLHDRFKHFETSMEFAEILILEGKIEEGLRIYFEIALESVLRYQIPNLKKCVVLISEYESLLDDSQKSVLNMLKKIYELNRAP